MTRVLILAHGEPPSAATAQRLALEHDQIIATDGAIRNAARLGIVPDVLTGDFDSVQLDRIRDTYPVIKIIETPDQDLSDLEKAVTVATYLGAGSITVIGATGGRIDHSLANTAVLFSPLVDICIEDDFGRVWAVYAEEGCAVSRTLNTAPGDTVSLVTFERHTIVSIAGVQWQLVQHALKPGTQGVSNMALGGEVTVTAHHGAVFVCHLCSRAVREHSARQES